MTSFSIERFPFSHSSAREMRHSTRLRNWPVVYTINGDQDVYVGQTINAASRMHQHQQDPSKASTLSAVRVVVDDEFNVSVCLDLESHLIRWLSGDGVRRVLNSNAGVTDAEYFDRKRYRTEFAAIFDKLRSEGLFAQSIPEIENSSLFKLSPFKALTDDQEVVIYDILEGLFEDLKSGSQSMSVVQGDPGTGKTVVGVYLMKLIRDIAAARQAEHTGEIESTSTFAEFFTSGFPQLLDGMRIGLVVPQQSLAASIREVFRKVPGLSADDVVTPFDVGNSTGRWDLLIIDETHRLNRGAGFPSGMLVNMTNENNKRLFPNSPDNRTQLDWIRAQSDHQIFLLDGMQRVRPPDIPRETLDALTEEARSKGRRFRLTSQMRVKGGAEYVKYVQSVLLGGEVNPRSFEDYTVGFFEDFGEMVSQIRALDAKYGLARVVSGFAFPWPKGTRNDQAAKHIVLDGVGMPWNRTKTDWINTPTSLDEVGSIHTVQGYDLNYAGVIIGNDLRLDPSTSQIIADRQSYFDTTGKNNIPKLGVTVTDAELTRLVQQIYVVLLTRGMLGTFVYVQDTALREYLRPFFTQRPSAG